MSELNLARRFRGHLSTRNRGLQADMAENARSLRRLKRAAAAMRRGTVRSGSGGGFERERRIVQFDNVGLRYGTGAETLSDLSFTLRDRRLLLPHRPVGRRQDRRC